MIHSAHIWLAVIFKALTRGRSSTYPDLRMVYGDVALSSDDAFGLLSSSSTAPFSEWSH